MDTLEQARTLAIALEELVDGGCRALAGRATGDDGTVDQGAAEQEQGLLFDLATLSSAVTAGREVVERMGDGDLALVHLARVAADASSRLLGRGVDMAPLDAARDLVTAGRDMALLTRVADRVLATGEAGPRALADDIEMVRQSFRSFAEAKVMPMAERIHREDLDVPEDIISGLAELGTFALSVPEEYGGLVDESHAALYSMLVATEELSRASLGAAGSLSTRPEIVAWVIAKAGTEEQKSRWLPEIASGAKMTSIAITEPGTGSNVAAIRVTARPDGDGYVVDGVKTWCTFGGRAEYLAILARTDPSPTAGHRGLSLVMIEKPAMPGHHFELTQEGGGRIEGRAIPTLGYRGMHSFEISFEGWRIPADAIIGGEEHLGRGFYLQMEAFANARVQTSARAQGIIQAAIDASVSYTKAREIFGQPLSEFPLTKEKIALMAATLTAARGLMMLTADRIAAGDPEAGMAAAQSKLFAGGSAEWITREALQLHGGYGYAEEYAVSRLFVDARVLSIFEGANEVLALKIIGRTLLNRAAQQLLAA
jgi:(2S)-methylsuccinyl-CoA dehydrogenase